MHRQSGSGRMNYNRAYRSDGELVFPVYKPEVKEDLFEYHVQFSHRNVQKLQLCGKLPRNSGCWGKRCAEVAASEERAYIVFGERVGSFRKE